MDPLQNLDQGNTVEIISKQVIKHIRSVVPGSERRVLGVGGSLDALYPVAGYSVFPCAEKAK